MLRVVQRSNRLLLELCAPSRDRRKVVTRATAGKLLLELRAPGRDRRAVVTKCSSPYRMVRHPFGHFGICPPRSLQSLCNGVLWSSPMCRCTSRQLLYDKCYNEQAARSRAAVRPAPMWDILSAAQEDNILAVAGTDRKRPNSPGQYQASLIEVSNTVTNGHYLWDAVQQGVEKHGPLE